MDIGFLDGPSPQFLIGGLKRRRRFI